MLLLLLLLLLLLTILIREECRLSTLSVILYNKIISSLFLFNLFVLSLFSLFLTALDSFNFLLLTFPFILRSLPHRLHRSPTIISIVTPPERFSSFFYSFHFFFFSLFFVFVFVFTSTLNFPEAYSLEITFPCLVYPWAGHEPTTRYCPCMLILPSYLFRIGWVDCGNAEKGCADVCKNCIYRRTCCYSWSLPHPFFFLGVTFWHLPCVEFSSFSRFECDMRTRSWNRSAK